MTYQDKQINCVDCGNPFTFTAREQEFFASKGYSNEPKRCLNCRQSRRTTRSSADGAGQAPRQMFTATCAQCGKECQVPFQPRQGKPVYCSECYSASRSR
ncbi:MAG TPA: zinc-ribbon domain containing protein [Dehalococcoidales bacterium]|nr:zinc-ribbon domain containing protein [Dehalococcoidales bacterium]